MTIVNEYYKMPYLTVLDSYSRCMHNDNANVSLYCIVKTKIKPDSNNAVWNIIKVMCLKSCANNDR